MLFEVHDILLHRLWKGAEAKYQAWMAYSPGWDPNNVQLSAARLRADFARGDRIRWWRNVTRRWYMNHHPKLSNSMIPYVRVFNGLPW